MLAVLALSALFIGLLMYERLLLPTPGLPADGNASAGSNAPPVAQNASPAHPASSTAAAPASAPAAAPASPAPPAHPPDPVRPVPGNLLRGFEVDYSPLHRDFRLHAGVDIAARAGVEVAAAWSGTVAAVEEMAGIGPSVVIDHGDGRRTIYAPLTDIAVQPGQTVRRGQSLGKVGTPPAGEPGLPAHLHFELHRDGKPVSPPLR